MIHVDRAGNQPRRRVPRRVVAVGKGAVGAAVAVVLWEVLRLAGLLDPRYAPAVGAAVAAAVRELTGGTLLDAAVETLQAWALGLAIAVCLGVPAGVLLGLSQWADAAASVVVRFLRPVPSLALIPVAILVAGLGMRMVLMLVAFACFWPVLFNARYGVLQVEPGLVEAGRALRLRGGQLVRRVILPAAAPSILTGVRVAASIALVVVISSELVTGIGGLGQFVMVARTGGTVTNAYAAIGVGGLIGYLINLVLLTAETRLLRWSAAHRDREPQG